MDKKRLNLIRRIRQQTLYYSISYLSRQPMISLEIICRIAEENVYNY